MYWGRAVSRRIAIVEDEAAIRENYADVLRKQGYEVQTYSNRQDAMSAFDLRLPNLAIIDIGLESEIDGGFTLCQALRSLSDTLPIIFLTARDNDFDTVSGLKAIGLYTKSIGLYKDFPKFILLFVMVANFSIWSSFNIPLNADFNIYQPLSFFIVSENIYI